MIRPRPVPCERTAQLLVEHYRRAAELLLGGQTQVQRWISGVDDDTPAVHALNVAGEHDRAQLLVWLRTQALPQQLHAVITQAIVLTQVTVLTDRPATTHPDKVRRTP